MRKSLVLAFVGLAFIACDYATESVALKPDIEIVYLNPLGWYTGPGDTLFFARISETHFIPRNSMDSYLQSFSYEYWDENDNLCFRSLPLALYAKIEGRTDTLHADTFILYNVSLPLDTIWTWCANNDVNSIKVNLFYVYTDEYFSNVDTCKAWWGIYYFD